MQHSVPPVGAPITRPNLVCQKTEKLTLITFKKDLTFKRLTYIYMQKCVDFKVTQNLSLPLYAVCFNFQTIKLDPRQVVMASYCYQDQDKKGLCYVIGIRIHTM